MTWMQELYQTYESSLSSNVLTSDLPLPICHTTQNAHVEVVIDLEGNFLPGRSKIIEKGEGQKTVVPCTEKSSSSRTGIHPSHHALCDKLQYLAGDYVEFGGKVTSGFMKEPSTPYKNYVEDLVKWVGSTHSHPKAKAVLAYVKKSTLIKDLANDKILPLGDNGKLRNAWEGPKKDAPKIFSSLPQNALESVFVRWRVESPGDTVTGTWEDATLFSSWINFYSNRQGEIGLCMASGEKTTLAKRHPAKICKEETNAKLISSNDSNGFTYRGRFTDASQACGVGDEVSQKAHNALRWLIERQSFNRFGLTVVAWSTKASVIPDVMANTYELFGMSSGEDASETPVVNYDAAQAFGQRLAKYVAGYRVKLGVGEHINVMALAPTTPGRIAISCYQKLSGAEFIERVSAWHENVAWEQSLHINDKGKNKTRRMHFFGAPSPESIARAAYGPRLDNKLGKATSERILRCIIDGEAIPIDLVRSTFHRACNRPISKRGSKEEWEWNETLNVACSLYRGHNKEERFQMVLENERTSRDYLYGRLLAVAEHIEARALHLADENRSTNAERLMRRFADHPFTTWPTIYHDLKPYLARLRSRRYPLLVRLEKKMDEIKDMFNTDDFNSDAKLSGEFLLGYHCQRRALWAEKEKAADENGKPNNDDNEQ